MKQELRNFRYSQMLPVWVKNQIRSRDDLQIVFIK